jgi:hypothetical protein
MGHHDDRRPGRPRGVESELIPIMAEAIVTTRVLFAFCGVARPDLPRAGSTEPSMGMKVHIKRGIPNLNVGPLSLSLHLSTRLVAPGVHGRSGRSSACPTLIQESHSLDTCRCA